MKRTRRRGQTLAVGEPDVSPSAPSHVRGVREGNRRGGIERAPGVGRARGEHQVNARRSTGICAEAREPIDPAMPRLTPA